MKGLYTHQNFKEHFNSNFTHLISRTACRQISQHVTATFYANNQVFSSRPLYSRPSRTRSFYISKVRIILSNANNL